MTPIKSIFSVPPPSD